MLKSSASRGAGDNCCCQSGLANRKPGLTARVIASRPCGARLVWVSVVQTAGEWDARSPAHRRLGCQLSGVPRGGFCPDRPRTPALAHRLPGFRRLGSSPRPYAGPARALPSYRAGGPLGSTHTLADVHAPAPIRPPEPRTAGGIAPQAPPLLHPPAPVHGGSPGEKSARPLTHLGQQCQELFARGRRETRALARASSTLRLHKGNLAPDGIAATLRAAKAEFPFRTNVEYLPPNSIWLQPGATFRAEASNTRCEG